METKKGCSWDSEQTEFWLKSLYPACLCHQSHLQQSSLVMLFFPKFTMESSHHKKRKKKKASRCMFSLFKRVAILGRDPLTSEL